jgi:hypothetical protein
MSVFDEIPITEFPEHIQEHRKIAQATIEAVRGFSTPMELRDRVSGADPVRSLREQEEPLMTRLAGILEAQHTLNQQQAEFNRRQLVLYEDMQTLLVRIETLLARIIAQQANDTKA